MIVWFCANVVLSVMALGFIQINSNAPHRFRFVVSFIAMCCWLVPGNLLGALTAARTVPVNFLPDPQTLGLSVRSVSQEALGLIDTADPGFPLAAGTLLISVSLFGLLLFAISCVRYVVLLRQLARTSTAARHLEVELNMSWCNEYVQTRPKILIQRSVAGALTTGFFTPTIWIHESLIGSPNLRAVLVHEFTHAKRHDNAYLWAITFIQNLFWWNPIVICLSRSARRLLELSCDELCDRYMEGYRDMLNRLIVGLSSISDRPRFRVQQASSIFGESNFNVRRIRALEKRYVMRVRHYVSTAILLFLSAFSLNWALAQNESALHTALGTSAMAQQSPLPDEQLFGIAMYGVFAMIATVDEQQPGRGAEIVKHTIGIESDEAAKALAAYMIAGYDAGHASSAKRMREFCQRNITTQDELVQALEAQDRDHHAELVKIVSRAADIVSADEYLLLAEYATKRQSGRTLTVVSSPVDYAGAGVEVAAEVARRCD